MAGTGRAAYEGDGRRAEQTSFYLLSSVHVGPDGRVYVMDFNNMRLRVVTVDGRVETVAGNGIHDHATPGVPAAESPLENPIDFDFRPDGTVVLVMYHDPRVLEVDAGGVLRVISGGEELGAQGDGGPWADARFVELSGIAVGPDGSMFVSDDMDHRVRVLRADGTVGAVAGDGHEGMPADGAQGSATRLRSPQGLDVAPDGTVFVADHDAHVVLSVTPDGVLHVVAGTGEAGFSGDGGAATVAQLDSPEGVAVGADGTLYISDTGNDRIRAVGADRVIRTIAGSGTAGLSGDGGDALRAQLHGPSRLEAHGSDLHFADMRNHCARLVRLR